MPASRPVARSASDEWSLPAVTYSAADQPVSAVLSDLCALAGVAAVIPDSAAKVTVEFDAVSGRAALVEVARLGGFSVEYRDGVVVFPPLGDVVHDFVVLRPGVERIAAAQEGLVAVMGSRAKATPVGGRLVVTGDRPALAKAAELAAELETGTDGWVVEVRVVEVSAAISQSLGLDVEVGGAVGVGIDAGVGHRKAAAWPVFGARAALSAEAILRAAWESREARVVRGGRVFVLEGSEGRLQQGDVVPVPRRTVSDQGTVTVTGFDRLATGFGLTVRAERVPGGVRLDLDVRLGGVIGYVEGSPITSETTIASVVAVSDGGFVILSGFESVSEQRRRKGLPVLTSLGSESFDGSDSSVVVLLQARRVMSSDLLRSAEP